MKGRSPLLSLPVLLVAGGLLFWSLRSLDRHLPDSGAVASVSPRYELENSEWVRTGADGQPQFVARAAQMSWYDDQSAQLREAELSALGGRGSPWRLSAPQGHLPAKSQDVLLSGPVQVTGRWPDGADLQFTTDRLWVDTDAKMFRTDAEVALQGRHRNVLATGLEADFEGRHIQLLSKVKAQYDMRARDKPAEKINAPRDTDL